MSIVYVRCRAARRKESRLRLLRLNRCSHRLYSSTKLLSIIEPNAPLERFYTLTNKDLVNKGGQDLLLKYGCLATAVMKELNHPWKPWKFVEQPPMWWRAKHAREQFADELREKLGGSMESLYRIRKSVVVQHGGLSLLENLYDNSPAYLVMHLFPDHPWKPWKFTKTPRGWWPELAVEFENNNPRAIGAVLDYLDDLRESFGLPSIPALLTLQENSMTQTQLDQLAYLGGLNAVLEKLFPQVKGSSTHRQDTFSFLRGSTSAVFWAEAKNRRGYLEQILADLGGKYESLYYVTKPTVARSGGLMLITAYGNSVPHAIVCEFPEHAWKWWKFSHAPRGWWSTLAALFKAGDMCAETLVREYVEELVSQLDVSAGISLRKLSAEQLGYEYYRLTTLGGIDLVLQRLYPGQQTADGGAAKLSIQMKLRIAFEEVLPLEKS